MVGALLGLPRPPESDHAADALAVAICHASQSPASNGVAEVGAG
jgi:Holliday junction resolvasome RuvABC endonuclease subunit